MSTQPGTDPQAQIDPEALNAQIRYAMYSVYRLDEPFDGVDPIGVEATFDVVSDARARGAAVLLSTHLRELAIEACTTALVLRGGARVADMDALDLRGEAGADAYRALLD